MKKNLVKELIQNNMNLINIKKELDYFDVNWYIYENNSSDSTPLILKMLLGRQITLETVVILNKELKFFQILALIPGASRTGVVITGSRFLNFSRYDAAKISFILSRGFLKQ